MKAIIGFLLLIPVFAVSQVIVAPVTVVPRTQVDTTTSYIVAGTKLNGCLNSWASSSDANTWTESPGSGGSVLDTAEAYDGGHAMRLQKGAVAQCMVGILSILTNGANYQLTFRAKRIQASTTTLQVLMGGSSLTQSYTLTDDWTLYTCTHTADFNHLYIRLNTENNKGCIIDAVTLKAL
jgi:hypothetical protein